MGAKPRHPVTVTHPAMPDVTRVVDRAQAAVMAASGWVSAESPSTADPAIDVETPTSPQVDDQPASKEDTES